MNYVRILFLIFFISGCAVNNISKDSQNEISSNQNYVSKNIDKSVSLSFVANEFFMNIVWDPTSKRAILEKGEESLIIEPGQKIAIVSGSPKTMEFEAFIKNKEIYIPKSFFIKELKPILAEQEIIVEEHEDIAKHEANLSKNNILHDVKSKFSNFCVLIDPGHGGRDPGAIGINKIQEKKITLEIAKKLAYYLKQTGIKTIFTRDKDEYVSLDKRVEMANKSKCDCFISIHLNSFGQKTVSGFEIWISQNNKDKRDKDSQLLARWIERYISQKTNLKNRGVRKSKFRVIHETTIPAVLVECCFISNSSDVEWLLKEGSVDKIAHSIYLGTLGYYYLKALKKRK